MSAEERRLAGALAEAIRDGRVAMVGPVRQEVLSGIKYEEQFQKVRKRLEAYPDEPIDSEDYVEAARLDNLCRQRGVQCGEVDMLLCATAVRKGWTILTTDAALLRCIEVVERELFAANAAQRGARLRE